MANDPGTLEYALTYLMPASIQWLIDRGYITRTYEGTEQVIFITEAGEEYFNALNGGQHERASAVVGSSTGRDRDLSEP